MDKNIFKYKVNFFVLLIISCGIDFFKKYQEQGVLNQIITQISLMLIIVVMYYLAYFIFKALDFFTNKYLK